VVRDQLLKQPKGDKAFVDVLLMAKETGVEAMETACELTLESGIINASVVINELRRLLERKRQPSEDSSIVRLHFGWEDEPISSFRK